MTERQPVTVYLDTQDYSRFGDVIRSRASPEHLRVYTKLTELRRRGIARFAYSMPIVSELLQYDSEYEETCLAKAQAVEELCDGNALLYPGRLVEKQAAAYASSEGLVASGSLLNCVQTGNEWFPRITGALTSLKDQLQRRVEDTISAIGPLSRNQRRALKKLKTDSVIIDGIRAAIPEISDKYRLPPKAVETSVVALLAGRITPDEASRRLFGSIAKPTSFVHVYFKVYEGEKDLPVWMRSAGEGLKTAFERLRADVLPTLNSNDDIKHFRGAMAAAKHRFGTAVLRLIDTDEMEFGITDSIRDQLMKDANSVQAIAVCRSTAEIFCGYIDQTIGGSRIEHSFGGDLVHAMYLDCVDLWRGDRRFCELVRQRLPEFREKIEPSLTALPGRIEELWANRS